MVYATVNCTAPIRRATGRRWGWAERAGQHPEGGGCTGRKDLADWGLVVRALLKKEPEQAEAGSRGRHNLWEAGRWTRPGWRCKPARGYASRALLSPHHLSSALGKTEIPRAVTCWTLLHCFNQAFRSVTTRGETSLVFGSGGQELAGKAHTCQG